MSVSSASSVRTPGSLLPDPARREKLRKRRTLRDGASLWGVGTAGIGVIIALGLIFAYLFYETLPLLKPVSTEVEFDYTLADAQVGETLHILLDRFEEVGAHFSDDGRITTFNAATGSTRERLQIPVPADAQITSFGRAEPRRNLFVYGYSDGSVLPIGLDFAQSFVDGQRQVRAQLTFPLGEVPITMGAQAAAGYSALAVVEGRGGLLVAGGTEDGRIAAALFATRTNMMTGTVEVRRNDFSIPSIGRPVRQLLANESLRNLMVIDDRGYLFLLDTVDRNNPFLIEEKHLTESGVTVTAAEFLVGSRSLIVGGSDGSVRQWILVRDEATDQPRMTFVRSFRSYPGAIRFISPEYLRKGFLAGDDTGTVGLHYATASATLAMLPVTNGPVERLAIGPNNSRALVTTGASGRVHTLAIDNPHPQTSLSALWGKVWYEGRAEPQYIWQSSSGDDAFEAKLSLVPLSLGTLKAALFAMLLAMPLAIMGAVYAAYFMAPSIRRVVKPSIELMEALPTVILGFLAGIWLAPFVENNLPILVTGAVLFPTAILLAGFGWSRLPASIRTQVPDGWEAALLVPVVLLVGWFVVTSSPWIEVLLFDGSMRQWFTDVGIPYDQRNALIVGMAMGFAVIPTIFSIAEDAVFNVPRHLTMGSLALGASRWQTVTGVVLLTASPGIFSAVMIGFGRAVGETMIVLMASGNSPIVNFNLFEGMRTLAANIAVELPETAVGGTHFRVLFLSALVLLVFTFILNTAAEVVRQRLRKRYASL